LPENVLLEMIGQLTAAREQLLISGYRLPLDIQQPTDDKEANTEAPTRNAPDNVPLRNEGP